MRKPARIVGWCCDDALTPEQAADKAIAKVALAYRAQNAALHYDLVTGRITLAPVDAPAKPHTFVRGINWRSDPDVLADDLSSEALAARLIRAPDQRAKLTRRAA